MPITHLVALGSSFAAGPGIAPIVDRAAGRSGRNYAHVLAERLSAELTDLTVSGATTETILRTGQRHGLRRSPAQIAGVPSTADLVTITAGGNDLGYIGAMTAAGWAGWLRTHRFSRPLGHLLARRALPDDSTEAVERAAAGLVGVVDAVRRRAPRARVVLVDYLTLIGPQTRPDADLGLAAEAIERFRAVADRLAGVFATASERSGAELVRCGSVSLGHALGSVDPWVNGLRPRVRGDGVSFHPNGAGMAAAAEAVLQATA